jgi:nitrogenase subunit NifH
LTYPNYQFVSLLKELADIATEMLSYLAQENICKQLVTILHPHLIRNSLFICNTHKDKICKVIIELFIELLTKPLLNNSCSQKTDSTKRKSIANKPIRILEMFWIWIVKLKVA